MNLPELAPKDGSVFLADIGWPHLVSCSWNEPEQCWVYAMPQIGLFQGEWNDTYFENEYEKEKKLKGWMPLPQL